VRAGRRCPAAGPVIARQQLERDQVTGTGDPHRQAGQYVEHLRQRDDLRLDSGAGEQQVDDHTRIVAARRSQPHGRETSHRVLLDSGEQLVASGHQRADEGLGVGVVGDGDSDVDVPGEAGLGPDRDGESSDQRPGGVSAVEVRRDSPEGGLDGVHRAGEPNRVEGRPVASPNSAPARRRRQSRRASSTARSFPSRRRSC
jgi:hypothetical protein